MIFLSFAFSLSLLISHLVFYLHTCIFCISFLSNFICADTSPGHIFYLSPHPYIVGLITALFCLTGRQSTCCPSCTSSPQVFPKFPLGIFSFYSHPASSLLPPANSSPICLPLICLHLVSCIHTKNVIFFILRNLFCSSF